ncbi:MAG TPA: thiamine pyrophosphate-dependent enzyme [Anaeromyxobacteraceae bacterium]|nr:thiamine pyrophosphate-dependent enzyme [Anaeromyxobacteraceae bacterium]
MSRVLELGERPRGRDRGASAPPPAAEARGAGERPLGSILREDGTADPGAVALTDVELVRLHRLMLRERLLDERMISLQRQGRIGFYIGSIGEEAAVFGSAAAMEERDWIFPCYREHGAALLRGMPLTTFVCQLLGNAGDPTLGHQMPCHEAWPAGRFASISSPIATQIPHAVGLALAARLRGDDVVPLVYFGDGATSAEGFHTGLNFAGVLGAPVVLLCRNNGWAISVPVERQTAAETLAQKGLAYGVATERVDGNDLLAVHAATRRARARAAAGGGPTLIEAVTYRLEGHSTSDDPRAYRPDALVEPWRRRDPLLRLGAYLERRGALTAAGRGALEAEVKAEIQRAIVEAEAFAARPPVETLFSGVYAEPLRQQREQLAELRAALAADPRAGSGPEGT